jgi:CRP-like cAMP-binding protein
MQMKLVQAGWYESHDAHRIILRQGHPPAAFYIILSGSVVVKMSAANERFAKTLCKLKRGESFGELSILHSTKRQSTIITDSRVELLCISVMDFKLIFMSAKEGEKGEKEKEVEKADDVFIPTSPKEAGNMDAPDFYGFIGELPMLQGWPLHLMKNNPKYCIYNFFKNNSVLVRDSHYSDWLYIVKSGTCRILKKLRAKTASQLRQEKLKAKLRPKSAPVRTSVEETKVVSIQKQAESRLRSDSEILKSLEELRDHPQFRKVREMHQHGVGFYMSLKKQRPVTTPPIRQLDRMKLGQTMITEVDRPNSVAEIDST